jgi:glyoxalase family protein
VTLGPKREHRARIEGARVQRLAVRVQREQPPSAVGEYVELLDARDRQREVQAGGATQRIWMPGIVASGREHRRGVGGCGDAHTRSHVAEVARVLEQHDRQLARVGEGDGGLAGGALGEGDHAGRWRERRKRCEHGAVDLPRELVQARAEIRRELRCESVERGEVGGVDFDDRSVETQRVLDRVETFEHGERGIAARASVARDERSVLHSAIMAAAMRLEGIHHISAITADAPGNVAFYAGVLGLRMVKKTVNQDEPRVYHLFYGDEHGSPGMDLTFFEYPGAAPGIAGAGMVHRIIWRVSSAQALEFWKERLAAHDVEAELIDGSLLFADREGLRHELVPSKVADQPLSAESPEIPSEHALQGFDGVRAYSSAPFRSQRLLADTLGFARGEGEHWEVRGERRGGFYAYDPAPPEINRRQGAGIVHHVAFAAKLEEIDAWRERVAEAGVEPTPVVERFYFKSVYFREPSGVLFELATIGPGFAVDEDERHLGERLSLPPPFEPLREELEQTLTPLPYPPDWRKVTQT